MNKAPQKLFNLLKSSLIWTYLSFFIKLLTRFLYIFSILYQTFSSSWGEFPNFIFLLVLFNNTKQNMNKLNKIFTKYLQNIYKI